MEFSLTEIAEQDVELLPTRETLALINIASVFATNSSTALNVLTADSAALSFAGQAVFVNQS